MLEPEYEEDDELRESYAVEQLLDKIIVTAEHKKQTGCDWNVGTELYLVAWEGHGDEENSWQPYENISNDLIRDYERQISESTVLTAQHVEDEPEDDDDDDELMEVDVDASEVEQAIPVRIVKHSLPVVRQKKGGLRSVWVTLQYSDGSRTDGYVRSEFLGDTEEGLALLRAYTKRGVGHTALKYMPWV